MPDEFEKDVDDETVSLDAAAEEEEALDEEEEELDGGFPKDDKENDEE